MAEIWKDIVVDKEEKDTYKNIYTISNYGRIKRIYRNGNIKILKSTIDKDGYLRVNLSKDAREEIERLKLENKSLKSDVDFLLWVANWRRYEGGYRKNFDDEEMEEAADLFDKYCKDHNREETDGKVYHVINKVVVETLQ